jgi:hypothetical protein
MKLNKLFIIVFTLLGILFIPYSCKKMKDVEAPPTTGNDEMVQRFFKEPANSSDALKSLIAEIKRQDDKNHFAATIATKYGLPAWDKSYSNVKSLTNSGARGANDDSLQIFMVPFRGADSSVTSFLLCSNNNGDFGFRYYKKEELSHLYAANDSIKQLRMGLLSVFGYFENIINHNDSTHIGGIYGKTVKDVSINFGNSSTGGRISTSPYTLTICWDGLWAARAQDPLPTICWDYYVWNWTIDDMTWEDYSGGSGGGGGGAGYFPDGFYCPNGEWWCTMNEFREIDGIIFTSESYPGINDGYSWLWWENSLILSPYGGTNFGTWAIHYLSHNPNAPFSVFQNQFMTPVEGEDDDHDANYWDDPNLTFPQQTLPSWDDFSSAFPKHDDPLYDDPEELYTSIGGQVLAKYNSNPLLYQNTCALRVSKALNYSGVTISAGTDRYQGADGKYYFLSCIALLKWMKKTFGTPSGSNHLTGSQGGTNGENFPGLLAGKKGIYIMTPNYPGGCGTETIPPSGFCASGHADMINNSHCDGGCYFDAQIGGVHEIFIWELQ